MTDQKKTVHPLSRKAKKLTKVGFREVRKDKQVVMKNKEQTVLYHKVMFFKDRIQESQKKVYTPRELSRFIETYINRNDDQLMDENDIKRKVNRSNKADILQSLKDDELKQFKNEGYLIPDLTKANNVKWLSEWEGNMQLINQLSMKRFKSIDSDEVEENKEKENNSSTEPKSIRTQLEAPETSNPFAKLTSAGLTTTTTTPTTQ